MKGSRILFVLILFFPLLILSCGNSNGNNAVDPITDGKIIVDPSGSGDYTKIQDALDAAGQGTTVYVRAGTYHERVVFKHSGAENKYVTLENYEDETAVIDGTGVTINEEQGLVEINSKNYIKIIGMEICNAITTDISIVPIGLHVLGSSSHIEILNCNIHHVQTNVEDFSDARGVYFQGSESVPMTDIVFTGNQVWEMHTGTSEAMAVDGYIDGFVISNNTIHDCNNIMIDAEGHYGANENDELDYVRNGVISGNTLYNLDSTGNYAYDVSDRGAPAIYIDCAENVLVECNRVSRCDRGIAALGEAGPDYHSQNCIIRNNIIDNCWGAGMYVGGWGSDEGGTKNCQFLNNTLYKNSSGTPKYDPKDPEIMLMYKSINNIFKNNIVYANDDITFVDKQQTGDGNQFNNNLYFKDSGTSVWKWFGASYSTYNTFGGWTAGSSNDSNSVTGNPMFVNTVLETPDLHIQETSPAKNAGVNLADAGSSDCDGESRVSNTVIDIGADEVQE